MNRFLSIDPGGSWVGLARLHDIAPRKYEGSTHTMDVRDNSLFQIGTRLHTFIANADLVVVEDYQVRPTGFNAFSDGRTLRILGVIEYLAAKSGTKLAKVRPDKPIKAFQLWPKVPGEFMKVGTGDHSLSAWRILGTHLLVRNVEILQTFSGEPLR